MIYTYNKLKFLIFFNIIFTVIPFILVIPITYIFEKDLVINEFHYILIFIWVIMFSLSLIEINQTIKVKKSHIVRKSLFVEIDINWKDVKKIKYSPIFNMVTIFTEKSQITLNSAYKNYKSLYAEVIHLLVNQKLSIPSKLIKFVDSWENYS